MAEEKEDKKVELDVWLKTVRIKLMELKTSIVSFKDKLPEVEKAIKGVSKAIDGLFEYETWYYNLKKDNWRR